LFLTFRFGLLELRNDIDILSIANQGSVGKRSPVILVLLPLKVLILLLKLKFLLGVFLKSAGVKSHERLRLKALGTNVNVVVKLEDLQMLIFSVIREVLENLPNHLALSTSSHLKKTKALLMNVNELTFTIASESGSLLDLLLKLSCLQEKYGSIFTNLNIVKFGYLCGSRIIINVLDAVLE
jgi:hypothetical protein